MKKIILSLLLIPTLGFAQLTYQDLKYLADNTPNKSIEYIKQKGYVLERSKNSENHSAIAFQKLNKYKNDIDSFVNLIFINDKKNFVGYITFLKITSDNIVKTIEKLGYTLSGSKYNNNEICNLYESTNYVFEICEKNYSEDYIPRLSYYLTLESKSNYID
jgi:hypothetical protein